VHDGTLGNNPRAPETDPSRTRLANTDRRHGIFCRAFHADDKKPNPARRKSDERLTHKEYA